jgi:hypothetical protein
MMLKTLASLDERKLNFLFRLAARFMETQREHDRLGQARFWLVIGQALESELDGEPPEALNFEDLLDHDVRVAAQVCAGLRDSHFPRSEKLFGELSAVLETELRRRHREVIALENILAL